MVYIRKIWPLSYFAMHVKWVHLHNINIPCTLVIWNETPENVSHRLAAQSECSKNKCPTTTVSGIATLLLHARSIFARGRKVAFFVGSQL